MEELFINLALMQDRKDYHPEKNVMEHIRIVTERLLSLSNVTIEEKFILAMAGVFHDIGKWETKQINPKSGAWTSPGHEFYGGKCFLRNRNYAADVARKFHSNLRLTAKMEEAIKWIIDNHMKAKQIHVMKASKVEALKSNPNYHLLEIFTKADSMLKPFYEGENMYWLC